MGSIAARQVAREVVGMAGKGKRPNITQIAIKNGYSYATANSGKVQKTATYKAEIVPYIEKMTKLRDKLIDESLRKDLTEERLDTVVRSAALMTHDIQLLSGGKTENISVEEDRRLLIGIVQQLRISSDDSQ